MVEFCGGLEVSGNASELAPVNGHRRASNMLTITMLQATCHEVSFWGISAILTDKFSVLDTSILEPVMPPTMLRTHPDELASVSSARLTDSYYV